MDHLNLLKAIKYGRRELRANIFKISNFQKNKFPDASAAPI